MPSSSRRAQELIGAALLAGLGLAAWYGPEVWADSGSFVLVLFGTPVVCTAVALYAERTSRTVLAPVVLTVLAVVSLCWSLVTALGVGLVLVVPSFLLLAAATVSWLHRTAGGPSSRA